MTILSNLLYSFLKKRFGENRFKRPPPSSLFRLWLDACDDFLIKLLAVCAVIALVLGVAFPQPGESRSTSWIDGAAILLAISVVTMVQAVVDFSQAREFRRLESQKEDVLVSVIRDGTRSQISIFDVVVGDVCVCGTGDQIPADGLYISGQSSKHSFSLFSFLISSDAKKIKNRCQRQRIQYDGRSDSCSCI